MMNISNQYNFSPPQTDRYNANNSQNIKIINKQNTIQINSARDHTNTNINNIIKIQDTNRTIINEKPKVSSKLRQ